MIPKFFAVFFGKSWRFQFLWWLTVFLSQRSSWNNKKKAHVQISQKASLLHVGEFGVELATQQPHNTPHLCNETSNAQHCQASVVQLLPGGGGNIPTHPHPVRPAGTWFSAFRNWFQMLFSSSKLDPIFGSHDRNMQLSAWVSLVPSYSFPIIENNLRKLTKSPVLNDDVSPTQDIPRLLFWRLANISGKPFQTHDSEKRLPNASHWHLG